MTATVRPGVLSAGLIGRRHIEHVDAESIEGLETLRVIDAVKRFAITGEIIRLSHDRESVKPSGG